VLFYRQCCIQAAVVVSLAVLWLRLLAAVLWLRVSVLFRLPYVAQAVSVVSAAVL
jgi:hypothetical protein